MNSIYDFVVKPKGSRYNNSKKVEGGSLIVNTDNEKFQFTNREAVVISTPLVNNTNITEGDTIIVHHNIFRRWQNMKYEEKNSKSFFDEDKYFINKDLIYAYNKGDGWKALEGYCFIQPIKSIDKFDTNTERPSIGIVKYSNNIEVGSLVGFTPMTPYEFVIGKERLYRMLTQFITIEYEYQGQEEEYNPSWL